MPGKLLDKILAQKGAESILEFLSTKLSGSAFNSLMLEVYDQQIEALTPAAVLQAYEKNRFVWPVKTNGTGRMRFSLELLEYFEKQRFEILTFGPLAPFGTCAALGPVSQKKIISAGRGTEVVSDATNMLALEVAKRRRAAGKHKMPVQHLAALHRLVRAQHFGNPLYSAHFQLLHLVTSGRDRGDFEFEKESLLKHLGTCFNYLKQTLTISQDQLKILFTIIPETPNKDKYLAVFELIKKQFPQVDFELIERQAGDNTYYQHFRFKCFLKQESELIELGDGGFTNWTQQLLQNKKERLLISAISEDRLWDLKE